MKPQTKKSLLSRLRRVEGQARGLQRMVENEAYCINVITQAQAVKSALTAFENAMLQNHLETHVIDQVKSGQERKAITEILKVYKLAQRKQ